MPTARQRLKSPRSQSGISAHPTMVTLVNIIIMNGLLTSFKFHVNRSSHSWDKAISDSDLETPRSRSWVWSKGKVIHLAQHPINSLPFHFTPIRPTIPEIQPAIVEVEMAHSDRKRKFSDRSATWQLGWDHWITWNLHEWRTSQVQIFVESSHEWPEIVILTCTYLVWPHTRKW